MVDHLKKMRIWFARTVARDYFDSQQRSVDARVASVISKLDPFEPLMKEFRGIFSKEYAHPEDKLDAKGQLMMRMWGYQMADDPSFRYMMQWIIDGQGNETLKRAPVTPERIMYGRAQISGMILFRNEVERLAEAYKDELEKNKTQEFISDVVAE